MSNIESFFTNDDIAIEILSRLSAKDLSAGKCVSKRWNDIISNPLFLRVHSERLDTISGIFFHLMKTTINYPFPYLEVNYFSFDMGGMLLETFLDFLPEKVEVIGSSNGLLCCRSAIGAQYSNSRGVIFLKDLVIYVCNPTSKKWTSIRPHQGNIGASICIGFYPFESSLKTRPVYKLVCISRPETNENCYSFMVYSSETNMWRNSKEVCHCKFRLYYHSNISVGETFFWLAQNHHIVAFDVEKELSSVIKLPGPVLERDGGGCLGSSNGYLHYAYVNDYEITLWSLTDYMRPKWVLKHRLSILEFCLASKLENLCKAYFESILPAQLLNGTNHCSNVIVPVAFHKDVLYVSAMSWLYSYCWKTNQFRIICPTATHATRLYVLPYAVNLVAASLFNN